MSLWLPRAKPSLVPRLAIHRNPILHPTRIILASNSHRVLLQPHLLSYRLQSTQSNDGSRHASTSSTSNSETSSGAAKPPAPAASKEVSTAKAPLGTRIWKKVKHEAAHYWHGSKLLVSEVRISARLQWKILHGEALTRRERRQVSCDTFTSQVINYLSFYSLNVQQQTCCDLFRLRSS